MEGIHSDVYGNRLVRPLETIHDLESYISAWPQEFQFFVKVPTEQTVVNPWWRAGAIAAGAGLGGYVGAAFTKHPIGYLVGALLGAALAWPLYDATMAKRLREVRIEEDPTLRRQEYLKGLAGFLLGLAVLASSLLLAPVATTVKSPATTR